jgi:myo-inositol-1(or 4)-monophosphatase
MQQHNWTDFLTELAQKAGEVIKTGFASSKKVSQKSSAMDIVTEFDTEVENLLISKITEVYPDHLILGEEQNYLSEGSFGDFLPKEGFVWVIDPIDGTLNFASGIPIVAVSIALFYNGEPIAGVVYNPLIKEMFSAEKGKGAKLNSQCIQVKKSEGLDQALVGVSVARRKHDPELHRLAEKVGGMRALGSAANALAYVAAGRLDAYWEKDLGLWDIAAGMLLIQEAGGKVLLTDCISQYPVRVTEVFAGGSDIEKYIEIIRDK